MSNSEAADFEAWLDSRHASVTARTGNLALVDYQPVDAEPQHLGELPATVHREAGGDDVVLRTTGSGVEVDGTPVDGEVRVGLLQPDGTPIITWDRWSVDAFSLDGTDIEMRLYDSQAPALNRFDRIDSYEYDPSLVLTGDLQPYPDAQAMGWSFTRSSDAGHTKTVPGVLKVRVGHADVELLVFLDGPALVLVFADATTGTESYAPGRFLKLDAPAAGTTEVTVDFNRTIIPPCGFSNAYSCPLPPPQNRIAAPIRAGERAVVWHED